MKKIAIKTILLPAFVAVMLGTVAIVNVSSQVRWAGYDSLNQRIMSDINARMVNAKPSRKCSFNCSGSDKQSASSTSTPTPQPVLKYLGRFKRVSSVSSNVSNEIASSLTQDAAEQAQIKAVIDAIRVKYDREAAAKGWQNNVAGAMTYFLVAMSLVYNDSAPTAEQQDTLYTIINQTFDASPEIGKTADKDKQLLNDLLIGYTALPLATYAEAKQTKNAETLATAKQLAAQMSQLIFKSAPVKF